MWRVAPTSSLELNALCLLPLLGHGGCPISALFLVLASVLFVPMEPVPHPGIADLGWTAGHLRNTTLLLP